ncbi:YidB family protein [Streptomyces sp. NPDC051578]|uniref:YidB family protein n=1 Tax=Streptomyces sp. NPDC051578 TaxID=3365662 RepID=UPI00378BED8E
MSDNSVPFPTGAGGGQVALLVTYPFANVSSRSLATEGVDDSDQELVIPLEDLTQVESWVSTGANEPLPPQQVAGLIGEERLTLLGDALGLSAVEASATLAQEIPALVDGASPDGTLDLDPAKPTVVRLGRGQIALVKIASPEQTEQ